MATNTTVDTVSTGADKAKLAAAALLLGGSVAAYYLLARQDLWVRVLALLVLLAGAVAVFFLSETGRRLIGFAQDSIKETKKVVWPTTQEALRMTLAVFGFVVVMAIMLFATDKTLEWLVYGVILGWRS